MKCAEAPTSGKMMEDRVLTKEFASKFLVDADKWSKYRLRDRGLE
jgi:hypothetical protein